MTATSSLHFSAMEVPVAEDSMEMASPYERQADDFDIDIDLMEDHVSNMDSDMMGADDPPNTSQPSLFQDEVNGDADMADEPSEGSMVDADNIADEDYDVDVHYDETYEAEMQEDDQDETVDVTLPGIQIDAPQATEGVAEPSQDVPVEEPVEAPIEESIQGNTAVPSIPQEETLVQSEGQEPTTQDRRLSLGTTEVESAQHEQPQDKENTHPRLNDDVAGQSDNTNQIMGPKTAHVEERHVLTTTSEENPEASGVEPSPHQTADEHVEHAETHSLHETEDQGADDESLHPVKVLYQDNEISLFPPLEGDSAETFFLHDDDVAYDNVGKLFSSLRGVLLDNVAGNEVLVIDIDALGIQLTEDSSYTSKVTLHQILDIYLRLCHNDGTDEPEAMYLTLSTRLAVDSELASLDAAANEGKGLSQIDSWDDYDETGLDAEEIRNDNEASQSAEEPLKEARDDESAHALHSSHEEQVSLGDKHHDDFQEINNADQTPQVEQEHPSDAQAAEPEPTVAEAQHEQETDQANGDNAPEADASHDHGQGRDHFISEPGTASTSTVAPDDHREDDSAGVDLAEYHDWDDQTGQATGEDEFDEEEFTVQNEADDEKAQLEDEVPKEDDDAHVRPGPAAAPEYNEDSAQVSQGDDGHAPRDPSESTVEDTRKHQDQTPEPEDGVFGIAEDLMQTPAKEGQNDVPETFEDQAEEFPEDDDLPGPENDEDADDQRADNGDLEHYPEFEVTEAAELGETDSSLTDTQPHDNPSTKRSREDDEEWDLTEATTPDTKRRRS